MAKVNTLGVAGATLSLVGAGTFWLYAFLSGSVLESGSDALTQELRQLMVVLAALYIMGAVIGFLSQLGGLVQLSCLVVGLPVAWYLGYHWVLYLMYLVAFIGTSMLVLAMFIEYSRAGREFKAPPFSRIRVWSTRASLAGPLSKGTAKTLLVLIVACIVLASAFATYAWSADVSTLRISVLVNGVAFGSTNVSIMVDGEVVFTTYLEYDPDEKPGLYAITNCRVPAGAHTVEADAWNGAQLTQGYVDMRVTERALPFTTERTYLLVGYGSA